MDAIAATPRSDPPAEWIAVGRILGAFGVRGEVKVEPWSVAIDSVLNHARRWRLQLPAGLPGAAGKARRPSDLPFSLPVVLSVDQVRRQGGAIIATLQVPQPGAPLTREMVESLKGVEVMVDRADFPPAGEDEVYHNDLIGCQVVNTAGESLGRVTQVDDQTFQQLLRLDSGILIPFVPAHVLDIRLAAGEILVDWGRDWL